MVIKRNTWVLLGVFAIILAFGILYQRDKSQTAASVTPTASPTDKPLLVIDEKSIASVRVEDDQGKAVALGRDAGGLWVITEPKGGGQTDAGKAEQMVTQIAAFHSTGSPNATSDLSIFGLLKAKYTITVNLNGGTKHVIHIGDVDPMGDGYYVQVDGEAPQIVAKSSIEAVTSAITSPPYVPTATPTPLPTPAPVGPVAP